MPSDDLEMQIIRIRMKFGIDWYAYHVHLAIFSIFDPKMTFCDLQDDLGWRRDAYHWIQKKISNRSICILCIFGMKKNYPLYLPPLSIFNVLLWPWSTLEQYTFMFFILISSCWTTTNRRIHRKSSDSSSWPLFLVILELEKKFWPKKMKIRKNSWRVYRDLRSRLLARKMGFQLLKNLKELH